MTYPEPWIQKQVAAAAFMMAIMNSDAVRRKTTSLRIARAVTGMPIWLHAYTSVPIPKASCPKPLTSNTSEMK